jgi:hypothetical protein
MGRVGAAKEEDKHRRQEHDGSKAVLAKTAKEIMTR